MQHARYHWSLIRRRIKVVKLMSRLPEGKIQQLYKQKAEREKDPNDDDDESDSFAGGGTSRIIILPGNQWKMYFDNIMFIMVLIYIFILPLYVCWVETIETHTFLKLMIFDLVFLFSEVLNLLLGYKKINGE